MSAEDKESDESAVTRQERTTRLGICVRTPTTIMHDDNNEEEFQTLLNVPSLLPSPERVHSLSVGSRPNVTRNAKLKHSASVDSTSTSGICIPMENLNLLPKNHPQTRLECTSENNEEEIQPLLHSTHSTALYFSAEAAGCAANSLHVEACDLSSTSVNSSASDVGVFFDSSTEDSDTSNVSPHRLQLEKNSKFSRPQIHYENETEKKVAYEVNSIEFDPFPRRRSSLKPSYISNLSQRRKNPTNFARAAHLNEKFTANKEEQLIKPKLKPSKSLWLLQKDTQQKTRRVSEITIPSIAINDQFVTGKGQDFNGETTPVKRKNSRIEGFLKLSPKITRGVHAMSRKRKKSAACEQKTEIPLNVPSISTLLDTARIIEDDFRKSARAELKGLYSDLCVPLPLHWLKEERPIRISDIYVEPDLTFNRRVVKVEDLFIVQPNRSCKNPLIVIKGQPGGGKTALCQFLIHSWCVNEGKIQTLADFDVLLMVECRYVSVELMSSLRNIYLKNSINKLPKTEDDDYLLELLNNPKTLIILDGFDECQESCRNLLINIRKKLRDARVIVSTRLSGIRDIEEALNLDLSYDSIELLLTLFDEEKFVKLVINISRMYGMNDQQQFALLDNVDDNFDDLKSVLNVPLHVVLYLMLWIHQPAILGTVKNVIDVFDGVMALMRHQLLSISTAGENKLLERKDEAQKYLMEVGRVSLRCIQDRKFYFTNTECNEVKPHCETCHLNPDTALRVIMADAASPFMKNVKIFFHVTLMEHVAASFLDFNISMTRSGIFQTLMNVSVKNVTENSCASCMPLTFTPKATMTNSGTRNYQLDSTISHLVRIACKNNHKTFKMGEELAIYFSLTSNRNLVTLSNIMPHLQEEDHPFKQGLRKGLSNQSLPNPIHNWNLKHVVNLIKNGALKPTVKVKFSVEHNKNWGPIVNELVNLGSKPIIKVVLADTVQMKALNDALEVIENPSIPKLYLHFGFIEAGINELVKLWPFPKTMHIVSPAGSYTIEAYLACVALANAMGKDQIKSIRFTGSDSSYILSLLEKSLPKIKINFQLANRDAAHFEIFLNPRTVDAS